jgi:hypothetical protein
MTLIRKLVSTTLVGGALVTAPMAAIAAPTEATRAGATTVTLSSDFLNAIQSLNVTPSAVAPGKLVASGKGVRAWFKITTGAVDLGTLRAEISHEGGLALSAGTTRVELTSFAIEIGDQPRLTGLVTINDSLAGRLPLFDLAVSASDVGGNGDVLKVSNVEVTLRADAAAALNTIFGVTAFQGGLPIGTADVRAILEFNRH